MSHLIYARNNERTDLGEFTPEKVVDLILLRRDRVNWDRAYAEAYPDDYLAEYIRAGKESE